MSSKYCTDNASFEGMGDILRIKASIKDTQVALKEIGRCEIPDNYKHFLIREGDKEGNNSLSFFGACPHDLAQGEKENDILAATNKAADEDRINDIDIVIGRVRHTGEPIIFSPDDNQYHILDPDTDESLDHYPTIEKLISEWSSRPFPGNTL